MAITVRMQTPVDENGERQDINFITDASAIMMNDSTSLENYVTEINNFITENPSIVVSKTKPAYTCLWGEELTKKVIDNNGNIVYDNTEEGIVRPGQTEMNEGYDAGYEVGYDVGKANGIDDATNGTETTPPAPNPPEGTSGYYVTGYNGGFSIGYAKGYYDGKASVLQQNTSGGSSTEPNSEDEELEEPEDNG